MSAVHKGRAVAAAGSFSAVQSIQSVVMQDPSLSELKNPFPAKKQNESIKTLRSEVIKPEHKKSQVNLEVSSDGSDLSDHHLSTIDEKVSYLEIGTQSRLQEGQNNQKAYPLKHQLMRGGSRQLPDTDKLEMQVPEFGKQMNRRTQHGYHNQTTHDVMN